MSPEQAKGKIVDKRSDIWAFGCVLCEMLTGHVALPGTTIPDTLAAVLEREPNWALLPATTQPAIRRLVERCLEKDPKRRLRDIGDARIEIEEAGMDAEASVASASTRGPRLAWIVAAAALLMAAVFAIPAVRYLRQTLPTSAPELRLQINAPSTPAPTCRCRFE